MTVHSSVVSVKSAPAGSGVSYSHRYVTPVDTRLAVIPIGYGDGLPRAASNAGSVLVGGQRAQIAGAVCMDQIVVDLGADSLVTEGMPVVVFGPGDDGEPTVAEWATASDTIAWEIVTRIGTALRREYR
jgi:alanine racemase